MKNKLITLSLLVSACATANPISTDTFTATLDQESNGLHVTVNGQFSYMPNGSVIGISDLTAFSMNVQEYLAGNYSAPGYSTDLDLSAVNLFSFDPTLDLLTLSAVVIPNNPSSGVFNMVPNGPGEAILGIDAPEIGSLGKAYGPAYDPPVLDGSIAPEPSSVALLGAGLLMAGLMRFKLKRRLGL